MHLEKEKRGWLLYLPLYKELVVEYSLIAKYMLFPRELLLEFPRELTSHDYMDQMIICSQLKLV